MNTSRLIGRAVTVAAVVAGSLSLAVPAFAHVEVESESAQALATDATITFTAEAESTTAGLAKFQVVLPEGIAPADVALADAPAGWTLTPTADGYTVGGPALAPGKDGVYKITVKQLPNAEELVFKTLETYSDGRIDRWIELPKAGTKPEHPAPTLKLSAAAPGATPIGTPSAAPTSAAPSAAASASVAPSAPASPSTSAAAAGAPSVTASPSTAATASSSDSSSAAPIAVGAAVVVVLAAGGAWWWRRKRTGAA
ncbi:DUF1775 domain-containing protein [Kitasatospora sp. CM 4170]|uniref:DUF1775 domain-containing protein n=1 Tax=Kitasatospora aburaviensis TaxID=67265 RepID=A0ABW1FC00_9ACTN|nr:DUF1775 domain-containing protein [Kitasatospora sp. CM 4170]WNM43893.1 DUF1775 domain-containing protein [Kitasatospora sp. CM 4170]